MRRHLALCVSVVVAALAGTIAPAGAGPADSPCPRMTDSIARLYSASFLRPADETGYDYWVQVYSSTFDGLNAMANNFVASDEFTHRYGALDDGRFVDLVYRNVLGRAPDATGYRHWVSALGRGFDRGSLMISFSESEEYVRRTGTAEPLAGWGRWYPSNVTWACGSGPARLDAYFDRAWYADLFLEDRGAGGRVDVATLDRDRDLNDSIVTTSLMPGEQRAIRRVLADDVHYIRAYPTRYVEIDVASSTSWILVSWPD